MKLQNEKLNKKAANKIKKKAGRGVSCYAIMSSD